MTTHLGPEAALMRADEPRLAPCRCSSMAEPQPSKLRTGVRFSSSAPGSQTQKESGEYRAQPGRALLEQPRASIRDELGGYCHHVGRGHHLPDDRALGGLRSATIWMSCPRRQGRFQQALWQLDQTAGPVVVAAVAARAGVVHLGRHRVGHLARGLRSGIPLEPFTRLENLSDRKRLARETGAVIACGHRAAASPAHTTPPPQAFCRNMRKVPSSLDTPALGPLIVRVVHL